MVVQGTSGLFRGRRGASRWSAASGPSSKGHYATSLWAPRTLVAVICSCADLTGFWTDRGACEPQAQWIRLALLLGR
eukprot:1409168-Pyramimonas_sp.AAC.1